MPLGDNELRVVKFVQELLQDLPDGEPVTPDAIAERIDLVLRMQPRWASDLNRFAVTDELIRRSSVLVGLDTTLSSDSGHIDWLNASRKQDWRYWQRYREWSEKRLPWAAVEGLDRSSDLVLGLLEDPQRPGPWDRRGLVVGHVQSGKTGNYTGLICKAADAGYKIIIVLAGLHNNLRSQTQMRLDEGFLGYETSPSRDPSAHRVIGVGEIDHDLRIRPNYATNRADNGDFKKRNLGISPEQRPWLFVVKKNKGVLTQLLDWIGENVYDQEDTTGRRVSTHFPLLIIDDEADHASVDTGEQVVDEDGKADVDHQPTAINGLIRRLLRAFSRTAYVGYTATPFANIFIHERGETHREGLDLFPAAFIINLAAPSNYIGPSRVFGLGGLPLVVAIDRPGQLKCSEPSGHDQWMPPRHKKTHVPLHEGQEALPPSLAEAVEAFVLVCAARRLRGQANEHCSMLVHVSRFSSPVGDDHAPSVQQRVHDQIEAHVSQIRQRIVRGIDDTSILKRLCDLWSREFLSKHLAIYADSPGECGPPHAWDDVVRVLPDALSDLRLRRINGSAKDALDYIEHKATGLKVIAIGGDKLSRGLTLEGLTGPPA